MSDAPQPMLWLPVGYGWQSDSGTTLQPIQNTQNAAVLQLASHLSAWTIDAEYPKYVTV